MNLTPQGTQAVEQLANRYGVSVDAVLCMLQAVINGGGTMAQFSHPELGGSGQWMQGGMTMVGDMFNYGLKAKVDGLCSELSGLVANQPVFAPAPQNQYQSQPANASLFVPNGGGNWWPGDLGVPSSSGSQNNVRYAIFPATRRLAIDINGQVTVYDTLDHQIGGVGQQQGGDASASFTSQYGLVRLADLPVVMGQGAPQPPASSWTDAPAAGGYQSETNEEGDVFAKIERLAELHQRGILSAEEFSAKKAELLGRL